MSKIIKDDTPVHERSEQEEGAEPEEFASATVDRLAGA